MKHECAIVKDLLPLYQEEMTSPETGEFVKEHLAGCEDCRSEWEQMHKDDALPADAAAPLKKLKKWMRRKRIITILISALLVKCLLVGGFLCMNIPVDVPYTADRAWVVRNEDGSVTVYVSNGDDALDGWSFGEFDGGIVHGLGLDEGLSSNTQYYTVSARTTLWSKIANRVVFWDEGQKVSSHTYWPEKGRPVAVFYNQSYIRGGLDSEDYVLIYSDEGYCVPAADGGVSGEASTEVSAISVY